MKYLLSIILLTTVLLISCPTLQPTGWRTVIHKSPLEKIVTYYHAAFDSSGFGVVTGFAGQIYYTTDATATWNLASSRSFGLFALEINAANVWACGDKGNVLMSKNQAKSFDMLKKFGRSDPHHCRFLSFISDKVGWIASPEKLALTRDGGRNWSALTLPQDCAHIVAIDLFSEQEGIVLDEKGILYLTPDQGLTWRRLSAALRAYGMDLEVYKSPAVAMRFKDAKQGMIVAKFTQPFSCAVLFTKNGGISWTKKIISTDRDYQKGSVFLSRDMRTITLLDSENQTVSVFENQHTTIEAGDM
ncbi:MAG: hypothetical protein JW822_07550 [Spirochaetales bacterium]|nr:hypothetical protein [Spirochaetales bacterium]